MSSSSSVDVVPRLLPSVANQEGSRLMLSCYSCTLRGRRLRLELPMNNTLKTIVFWLVIVLSATLLWQIVRTAPGRDSREISYSEFLSQAENGNVSRVNISKGEILGPYHDGTSFRLVPPTSQEGMLQLLHAKNVEIWFRDSSSGEWPMQMLGSWAPLILLAALWFYMIRQLQTTQRQLSRRQDSQP